MCKKTILVVDDDITILTVMRKILEDVYDVSLAKSADAAWQIMNNIEVDLILLDVEMPKMSGLAFMDYLKENNAFYYYCVPVIFVTAHARPEIIMQAKKCGVKDFTVKPVIPDVLLAKIKALFDAKDTQPENSLLHKIHLLDIACRMGKSGQVETLTKELKELRSSSAIDSLVDEICAYALNFDYGIAVEKISVLIKNKLLAANV
ncbi:MAG: response regulator [Treponema sp.]|jgi:DNA-binding NtrC family response regulator|nr:response regulator [Treponema sp.]